MRFFRNTASIFLIVHTAVFAWGPQGHMMVAAIAWKQLKPPVRAEVSRLLKLNPNYAAWIAGVDSAQADEIAFLTAANWPDFIKGAAGYINDGDHPTGPNAADNIGYDDKLQHRYWHYYDTPFSPDGSALHGPDAVNALTQIRMFSRALRTKKDDSILSYDLVWLEHIAGDVHQPLHAASRFDEEDPLGDNGGNRVHLCSPSQAGGDPKNCRANLHAFWDGVPGSGDSATGAKSRADTLPLSTGPKAADLNPAHWINESFELAKTDVYILPVDVGDGPFVLPAEYKSNAEKIASQQIALAGARLSNLLNENIRTTH